MLDDLVSILKHECLLDQQRPILVGVSGGPDSLCLMDVLAQAGYSIIVAHLNHGLRLEADAEALKVQQYAQRLDVPFLFGKTDIPAIAKRDHLSIEEAARHERYRFLFSQAEKCGAQAVAVGHTADDQVETVLMHLIRGAGLAGLKGMVYRWQPTPWSPEIPLVRPLLGVWREQILEYVDSHGYQPVFDPSNLDTGFFRNRLRHELIPTLERYNPNARLLIWRTADLLLEDYRLIEQLISEAWQGCLHKEGAGYLGYSYRKILELSPGLQRHLIRRAVATLHPDIRDFDFEALQRVLGFINTPSERKEIDLWGGITLSLEGDILWLALQDADLPRDHWPQIASKERYELDVPGELHLASGWVLSAEESTISERELDEIHGNSDPYQAWIDLRTVNLPLLVRSRLAGERFAPLGMDGVSLKVSDFMVNVKLPRRARPGWPLVCATLPNVQQEEIIWIPGCRQSHHSRVITQTSQVVLLQLKRSLDTP